MDKSIRRWSKCFIPKNERVKFVPLVLRNALPILFYLFAFQLNKPFQFSAELYNH
jgi:hypothetical protein